MTCIIGVEYNGSVYIAGDLQGTGHNIKVTHDFSKVFYKGEIVIGNTTSYRFGQLLEFVLANPVVPKNTSEIQKWLVTTVVPDIAKVLKENDWSGGGNCLIGVRDQLWELQPDFSVLRVTNGYAAIGSGTEYALAGLEIELGGSESLTETQVVESLKKIIKVVSKLCPSVGSTSSIKKT